MALQMSLWETFFMGFVRFSMPYVLEIVSCSIFEYVRNIRAYYLCATEVLLQIRVNRYSTV